ncbi:hypothetical protein D9Q98_003978 [Chlorella vulgaris]|uniref:Nucleoporin Nup54 alpha-helical domain-containing protein n=1 Tax=Chlorella vulgaris TaxID=3077 RepID=A0A9D4TR18_CHLVU|nr:hypothetical protein D9Q98_003978 [Chlorella vulgaris]
MASFNFGSTAGFTFSSGSAAGAGLAKTASTPQFGTTTPQFGGSAPAFGAASTPSMFGASSAAAPAPFSFSTSQPAQQQPSMFGAAPASSPSLFGAATPAPSPFGSSVFGTQQQQQQQQQGLQQQQQQGMLGFVGGAAPVVPDLSAIRELESIKDSFVPGGSNPRYRFQHLLLNVVEQPAARVKPAGVDELAWRAALQRAGGPDNVDGLWPVQAQGFKDLLARKAAQDAAIKEHGERLEGLSQMAGQLASRQEAVLREQLLAVRRRHVQLCNQLLRVLRHIDALEGRFAQVVGYRNPTPKDLMQRLTVQLGEIEAALAPSAANGGGLQGKVAALAAAARLRAGAPGGTSVADLEARVDPAGMEEMFGILSQYTEAMGKLGDVLRRDARHVAMLEYAATGEKLS